MQKDRRKLKKFGAEMLTIGYSIYEVLYAFTARSNHTISTSIFLWFCTPASHHIFLRPMLLK